MSGGNPVSLGDPLGLAPGAPWPSPVTNSQNSTSSLPSASWPRTSNVAPPVPNNTASAQSKGSQYCSGDKRPSNDGVLQTTLFGGMAVGAIGGAIAGAYVGALEGAHLGLIGGLAVADAVYSGAMAGALAGGAVGVGVGLTVIGGLYIYDSLNP